MPTSPRKKQSDELKLYYYKTPGRQVPIRLALEIGEIPYEYVGLDREEFNKLKKSGKFTYNQIPYLEVNGQGIAQSMAILRYVGKKAKLYPEDPLLAAKVDEVIDYDVDACNAVMDVIWKPEPDAERHAADLKKMFDETIPDIMKKLTSLLEKNKKDYVVGDSLTIADLRLLSFHHYVKLGAFAPIKGDIYDDYPTINKYLERLEKIPKIQKYFEKFDTPAECGLEEGTNGAGSPKNKKARVDGSPTRKKSA